MDIELLAIGGYSHVIPNMSGIRIDDEIVLIDMGIDVDKLAQFGEREDIENLSLEKLYEIEAIPDDRILEKYQDKIKAILITHAHLDHCGAIPFLIKKYNDIPIYMTPYTYEVVKSLLEDYEISSSKNIKKISPNSSIEISEKVKINFISSTHSIPQPLMIDIETKNGHIVFSGDFKFDNFPIIGKRPNYEKLKNIGKENVILLVVESIRADEESKTPSEIVAKYMLYDVLFSLETEGIIVTTFASHIARLKSIIEIAYELGRKPILIGRSLYKYTKAAENVGLYNFSEACEIYGNSRDYPKILKEVSNKKQEYLLIVTGHQGEPGSVLDRLAKDQLHFNFENTTVIFSNNVIPTPINEANRKILEERLKRKKVHIIKDVHVSGHAKSEDHRILLKLLNPEYVIPNHGDISKKAAYYSIAEDFGYTMGSDLFMLEDGQSKKIEI
ncbi:MAG: RNase J family beta-CASP ribonuclease [Nanopusillaceae archaeon]